MKFDVRYQMKCSVLSLLILLGLGLISGFASGVILEGSKVSILGGQLSFELPSSWVENEKIGHSEFLFTNKDILKTEVLEIGWKSDFNRILDEIISKEDSVTQFGKFAWTGGGWVSPFVRIYVTDLSAQEIWAPLSDFEILKRYSRGKPSLSYSEFTSLNGDDYISFDKISMGIDLWYEDYGGPVWIEMYVHEFPGRQEHVVMVFLPVFNVSFHHPGFDQSRSDYEFILKSVQTQTESQ